MGEEKRRRLVGNQQELPEPKQEDYYGPRTDSYPG
jgi:hypothetical protein